MSSMRVFVSLHTECGMMNSLIHCLHVSCFYSAASHPSATSELSLSPLLRRTSFDQSHLPTDSRSFENPISQRPLETWLNTFLTTVSSR